MVSNHGIRAIQRHKHSGENDINELQGRLYIVSDRENEYNAPYTVIAQIAYMQGIIGLSRNRLNRISTKIPLISLLNNLD